MNVEETISQDQLFTPFTNLELVVDFNSVFRVLGESKWQVWLPVEKFKKISKYVEVLLRIQEYNNAVELKWETVAPDVDGVDDEGRPIYVGRTDLLELVGFKIVNDEKLNIIKKLLEHEVSARYANVSNSGVDILFNGQDILKWICADSSKQKPCRRFIADLNKLQTLVWLDKFAAGESFTCDNGGHRNTFEISSEGVVNFTSK